MIRPVRMSGYLKTLWSVLAPFREENLPLISNTHDLEACDNPSDNIVLVCDLPEVAAYAQRVRVSPFSEDHFPGLSSPVGP